jgi:hypothetical protein
MSPSLDYLRKFRETRLTTVREAGFILSMTTARHASKCQDRCGLAIHVGDEIEPGHFDWRHVDCDKAQAFAWIRERFAAGDSASDIQIKLLSSRHLSAALRMEASTYTLDYYNEQLAA